LTENTVHNDQYIIDGIAANDSKVVQLIYDKHAPKMINWMKQHGAADDDAQDVLQEALIDIFRKANTGTFSLSCPFDAFLFVLVRNKWYTAAKNNQKTVVTDPDVLGYKLEGNVASDADKIMQYEKQHEFLLSKLDELHDGCKELLRLSWKGLRMEQVAEKLKVSYAYVRKKKSLCIAKLTENIKNSEQYDNLRFER
jgi:RNA polymerase sigma factor (sigma-70 family)